MSQVCHSFLKASPRVLKSPRGREVLYYADRATFYKCALRYEPFSVPPLRNFNKLQSCPYLCQESHCFKISESLDCRFSSLCAPRPVPPAATPPTLHHRPYTLLHPCRCSPTRQPVNIGARKTTGTIDNGIGFTTLREQLSLPQSAEAGRMDYPTARISISALTRLR